MSDVIEGSDGSEEMHMSEMTAAPTDAVRRFRQEMFDEHRMYSGKAGELRDAAYADGAAGQDVVAFTASLMAAQFAYGLMAALTLVESRLGAEVAASLAASVECVMDGGWFGPDLAADLDGSDEDAPAEQAREAS